MPECDEPIWVRSPFCGNGGCIEVARLSGGQVSVRNSRDPAAGLHVFTTDEWEAFMAGVKGGHFDRV